MSSIICFNGQFLEKDAWNMGSENRSFLYGDGLFESVRFQDGSLIYIDDHLERLISGMFTLGLDTTFFNPLQICDLMLELCKQNEELIPTIVSRRQSKTFTSTCPEIV
jgi:branched-subunit amino acid aminotransferase/4-amino-4-deoxychorismate lyase